MSRLKDLGIAVLIAWVSWRLSAALRMAVVESTNTPAVRLSAADPGVPDFTLETANKTDLPDRLAQWVNGQEPKSIAETWESLERAVGPSFKENTGVWVDALAAAWRGRDPGAAIAFLAAKDRTFSSKGLRACVRAIGARDPDGWWNHLKDAGALDAAMLGRCAAINGLTESASRAAFNSLPPEQRAAFLDNYIANLSPGARLQIAGVFTADLLPEKAAALLCRDILSSGITNLSQWLGSLDDAKKARLLDQTYYGMVGGGRSAADYLTERLKVGIPERLKLQAAFRSMGLHDYNLGATFVEKLPPDLRVKALADLEEGRMNTLGVDQLIPHLATLRGEIKAAAILHLSYHWPSPDPAPMLDLIASLEDPGLKAKALGHFLASQEDMPLAQTRQILAGQLNAAPDTAADISEAIERVVVRSLNKEGSEGGVQWIASLPAGAARDNAVEWMAQYWSRSDPRACAEWVDGLPGGTARDRAVVKLVTAGADDPERAVENLGTITSPELRFDAATALVDHWKEFDPEGMLEILRTSGLSSQQIKTLEARISNRSVQKGRN